MALSVFGGGPGDVTSNSDGSVIGGVSLKVYTAAQGGQQVTELYDMTGAPVAGVVVSGTDGDDEGRVAFKASDQYQILFLDAGYGMRWALPSQDAFAMASSALSKSSAALDAAQGAQAIATESGVKADLAKAEVDAKLGFDITKLSPEFVTRLDTDPSKALQSFARNPLTGDYYVSQAIGSIGGTSNLVVHRCGPDGRRISTCTFEGGGHGSTTAIEADGTDVWVWFRWTYDSTGSGYTNRMVRARYQADTTVLRNDPAVSEVPDFSGDALVNFDIDQATDRIAIRVALSGAERYALYRLSDYKAGRNTPLAQVGPLTFDDGDPYQGHCTLDGHLYISRGHNYFGSACTITRIDWETGDQVVTNVDQPGTVLGDHPGSDNENEGVTVWRGKNGTPSLLFGKSVGSPSFRQGLVYAFNPPAGDDLSSETMRLSLQKERGRAVVTPLPNSAATSVQITFKRQFDTIPHVSLTPDSSAVGDVFLGCGVTAVTTSGFLLWMRRSTETATGIYWQADAS